MTGIEGEIFTLALRLLAARDYSVEKLREKLQIKFDRVPESVIEQLIAKRFLDDRRYAENYVASRKEHGAPRLRERLLERGIAADLADDVLGRIEWPSLRAALTAKMADWNLRAPLQPRDAARLFRAMARLGYEEDAIREEISQYCHEQQ